MPAGKLSIITVTLNNIDGLQNTLASVTEAVAQVSNNNDAFEILVKDGGSTDGSLDYLKTLSLPGLRWESSADGGIYEAMNTALMSAHGDWVLFLNAGDTFSDPDVLARLLSEIDAIGDGNFIYADCRVGDTVLVQSLSIPFLTAHMINHQSICYARPLLEDGYDTRYRLCADYAHLLQVYPRLKPRKLERPIASYDAGGQSSDPSNYHRMWRERLLGVWRSPLPFATRLRLSSRGVIMWPLQYLRALFL